MRGSLFVFVLIFSLFSTNAFSAEKSDAKKKPTYYEKEIEVDLDKAEKTPVTEKKAPVVEQKASVADKKDPSLKEKASVANEQVSVEEEEAIRHLSSSKKKKKQKGLKYRTKASEDFEKADGELEDTVIPSLEDSLGDTKDLKAQLLEELEEEHQVGSTGQGLDSYFEAKSPSEEQKRFDFQDMELQVVGRHSEKISGKKFKRDISSGGETPTNKKKAQKK